MSKIVIGVHGCAQVGKDTTGDYLQTKGFTKVALADTVREAAYKMNPIIKVTIKELAVFELNPDEAVGLDTYYYHVAFFELQYLVDKLGWDVAKKIKHVRVTLQWVGTEGGREIHGDDCWKIIAKKKLDAVDKAVVTDVRFPDEAEFIHDYPADQKCVIKVDRPGYGPINSHVSDAGICSELIDIHINNDGEIKDLHAKIDNVLTLI